MEKCSFCWSKMLETLQLRTRSYFGKIQLPVLSE